jgi:hypothetical protein
MVSSLWLPNVIHRRRGDHVTRAIIFVPAKDFEPHADRCMDHLHARGYQFQGMICGDWDAAQRMMDDGETSVVLVATETYLDPNRKPRIEVVANQQTGQYERHHRTARINRPGAGA